uniref:Uncharacterized protein n=1 Tax=Oryza brachyantha TaxID=4533 RepID=J3LIK7_ORYBR
MLCSGSAIVGVSSSPPFGSSLFSVSCSAFALFFFDPPYMKLPTITYFNNNKKA